MDIIIDLVIQLIRELLKERDGKNAVAPQSATPAAAARPAITTQDPAYDGEGWRRFVTIMLVIVLIVLVAAWIAAMEGWLPTG